MKNKLFLSITLFVCLFGFSQDKDPNKTSSFKQNEIKINGLFLILGAFEGSYERILNEESGVGVSVLFLLDKQSDIESAFSISPYYRFYFGEKPAAGFFIEGFVNYQTSTRATALYLSNGFNGYSQNFTEKINGFGFGLQIGGKWITKKGILFEVNGGVGRLLSINSSIENRTFSSSDKIIGRAAITIGYRFN